MVRRSGVASLDSGTESPEYGDALPASAGRGTPAAKPPWSGGGGRWLLWPMRIVLWVAILVIGYRGVMAIILNETPASTNSQAAAPASPSSEFPVTVGEAYALQFGQAYLNFSPDQASQRAKQLASIASVTVPTGGDTRDITVTVNWGLPGQEKPTSAQLATTYDMSVVDQQSGKWYVKEIRASTQPMGTQ